MLKIKGWSQAHDESVIEVIETVTRHQDPANNSNKFRRFISVWAPGERPYVFTHTGRWTYACGQGRWDSVGTFRAGDLIRLSPWTQSCRAVGVSNALGDTGAHMNAHETAVQRKLGEYTVTSRQFVQITNANVQTWLRKAEAIDTNNGGTSTPVATPPVAAPAPLVPGGLQAKVDALNSKPTPDRLAYPAPMMARVQNALQRSASEGADPFDVMADIATLRVELTKELSELENMLSDLSLANDNAMERL